MVEPGGGENLKSIIKAIVVRMGLSGLKHTAEWLFRKWTWLKSA
jgi:hypothetical protein